MNYLLQLYLKQNILRKLGVIRIRKTRAFCYANNAVASFEKCFKQTTATKVFTLFNDPIK